MPLRAALRPFVAIAFLIFLAAAAATALGCAAHRGNEPFSMVGTDEVQRMLSQPDVAVIDANPKDVFAKNHLPGARWYKSAAFAQVLPADKSTRLVFYCASPS
ncbi:MAG TPA: rhodanese-like domain-containing protein [Anaeromyxobacter sp.]|nr:rhodanese-like domain-containing protein [Anaeromyxobacter sp.]